MKKFFYYAAAAMAVLSSCDKENLFEENGTGSDSFKAPVFTATIEDHATKTTLADGNKVNWEEGDEVYIKYQEQSYVQTGYNPYAGGAIYSWQPSGAAAYSIFRATPDPLNQASATLAFSAFLPGARPEYREESAHYLEVVYPASLVDSENPAAFIFPATQTYNGDKISFAPMYYSGREKSFVMKNAASILSITVPASQMASVQSITVSSDEYMNGYCEFNDDGLGNPVMVIGNVEEVNKRITLICNASGSNTVIDGSRTFYISVPANHYSYLQIDVTDGTTTKSMRTTKAEGIAVERNKIYPITFAANVAPAPTTGTAKATIGGAEVDVNWVQLWAGGPKFAEYNVGASSSTDTGTKMNFTEATNNVWGANWCTPSMDDMDELVKASDPSVNDDSKKVTYEYVVVNGVDGFRFTGKEEGYTENSVFFPGQRNGTYDVDAEYWSGTTYESKESWYMFLCHNYGELGSEWRHILKIKGCLVRLVLNN